MITGPSCAGKTSVCDFFEKRRGIKIIHDSSIVKKRYEKEKVNSSILDFVKKEYETKGKKTFAEDFLSYAKIFNEYDHLVIEGIRSVEELKVFRENYDDVYCLGIFADTKTRFERNKSRGGREHITDYDKFIMRDLIEYSFGVSTLMAEYCDKIIVNESSVEIFYDEIEKEIEKKVLIF
ncbi:Dephospho-CoA kinase archaeal, predicted [Methanosarcina siciliae T4/M]|uniref:Dephospho-CoA kinase archaeal, predicted n=2 Tax=Methanosarcina siciliae TaxID=38027 RepID=A0A0E3P6U3_9EURY|nr:Dephospho-CoA kinase archaeal, predicted [Methanosarcina siciliae T4/M]